MKFSIERSMRLGFILVCGLLIGMAAVAYLNVRRSQDALAWTRHSRDVIRQIQTALSTLQDIETGTRGYVLTGDDTFREPYRQASGRINAEVAHLKDLTADNPVQQERAGELQAAVELKLTTAASLIAGRRSGSHSSKEDHDDLERGKQAMDQVRAVLASMDREEEDLRVRRRQAFDEATSRNLWTTGVLIGVMFLLLALSYLLVGGHLRGRRRAEAALRESEDRVRMLLDSTAEAITGVDREGLCTFANRATLNILGYSDPGQFVGKSIHQLAHHTRSDGTPYPHAECPILQVVQKGAPIHAEDDVFWRADGSSFPVEYWSYPIRQGGEITGAVVTFVDITSRKRAEGDLREANLKLSAGITELELRGQEISQMSEMAVMLQSCTAPEEAYQIVAQAAAKLFPGVGGALGVIGPSRQLVEISTEWGNPALGEQAFAPEDCWALRSGRPYLVENANTRLLCNHVTPAKCSSTFCVPMMALGESLGILFMSGGTPGCGMALAGQSSQQNLAVAFAESVSLALANLRLRETLRIQSIRDPLTTLFNRRYMEEFFDREMKRATRSQRPIGVILCDLDHFKRYNDTFGHDAGDVLLKETAALLRTHVRGDDIACRYGGEEFLLLMPDASIEITWRRAESLRNAVASLHVEHLGQQLGPVTLSAGVAIFPDHGKTTGNLLRAADQALYRAKETGRNRVVLAEQAMSAQEG